MGILEGDDTFYYVIRTPLAFKEKGGEERGRPTATALGLGCIPANRGRGGEGFDHLELRTRIKLPPMRIPGEVGKGEAADNELTWQSYSRSKKEESQARCGFPFCLCLPRWGGKRGSHAALGSVRGSAQDGVRPSRGKVSKRPGRDL